MLAISGNKDVFSVAVSSVGNYTMLIYCHNIYCVYMYGKPLATSYTMYTCMENPLLRHTSIIHVQKIHCHTIYRVKEYMYGKSMSIPYTVYKCMENLLRHYIMCIHVWKIYCYTRYYVYCMENLLLHHIPSIHVWKIYCYTMYCVYMYGKPIATPYNVYTCMENILLHQILCILYGKPIATTYTMYKCMENLLLHHRPRIHVWKIYCYTINLV